MEGELKTLRDYYAAKLRGDKVEVKLHGWSDDTNNIDDKLLLPYRIKPRTMVIGEYELPWPDGGDEYFKHYASLTSTDFCVFVNSPLQTGHSKQEDAARHGAALALCDPSITPERAAQARELLKGYERAKA